MKPRTNPRRPAGLSGLGLLLALGSTGAGAQALNLSQVPLYLGTTVKPNVLVLYDNSPSMEYRMPNGDGTNDLADPATRGNIARAALRRNITAYRNHFRWGLSSFAVEGLFGPNWNLGFVPPIPIAYYSMVATGRGAIYQPVQDDSTAHFDRLMGLLAVESGNVNSLEIKNGSVGTPLPGAVRTAYQYYAGTLAGQVSPITDKTCQRNFVVMATDGDPTIRQDGGVYTALDLTNTLNNGTWTFGQAAQDVFTQIQALRTLQVPAGTYAGQYDVQTYVIGLGDVAVNPSSVASMNRMAELGGTGTANLAADEAAVDHAFSRIVNDIAARTSASSSVAMNTGSWSSGADVYQARFNSGDWSGQLQAFRLDTNGAPQTPARWDAAQRLNAQHWSTGRRILTYKPSAALGQRGVPFRWPANAAAPTATEMDATMVAALNRNLAGTADNQGALRLNYLRGDVSRELRNCAACTAPTFRNRPMTVLGDIVNASPVHVKGGDRYIRDATEAAGYATYRQSRAAMTPLVVVGANDGMVHAFSSATGDEVFAYVPGLVADRLSALTDPAYQHRYIVDGQMAVGDVQYGGAWRTVLVGGLGAGVRGLYALDLTDPANFTEANAARVVRWEIGGSDADVGHILHQPVIAKMRNGRWMAVLGNGYNSTNGTAVLLLVDVETGAIRRIPTYSGGGTPAAGLSGVALISTANNGIADVAYAGDTAGNLWKFDLSSSDPAQWKVSYQSSGIPQPLHATGQPITSRPDVTPHPQGGYLVAFGTGRYIATGDAQVTATQALYGIWDKGQNVAPGLITTQRVLGTAAGPDGRTYRLTTHAVGAPDGTVYTGDNTITRTQFMGNQLGWKLELPASGERIVAQAAVRYGKVVVSTLIPSTDPCGGGGDGWIMEVDAVTGNRPASPALDINADNAVDATDKLAISGGQAYASGVRIGAIPTAPSFMRARDRRLDDKLVNTSNGDLVRIREAGNPLTSGRAGWEQIQ